ncbi:MAG TPA: hypothetical protein VFZ18_13215 [Longimicrobiaceae bacterium]
MSRLSSELAEIQSAEVEEMLYVAVALVVYVLTALDLMREAAPQTFREALGGALACTLVAAAWPVALVWRGLLGGAEIDRGRSVPADVYPGEVREA